MISRQKLIEELTDVIIKHTCKPSGCQDCLCAFEYGIVEESCEEYLEYHKLAEKIYNEFVINITNQQPPASQWIPCSEGTLPADGRTVPVTTEFMNRRHITTATYYTKKGVVDDYEWTGEGFYQYDSEYGYGRLDDVVAWLNVEPYKGVE